MNTLNLVVLISGNGTNLQAIIDAINIQRLPARIKAVISNKRDAYGLERASRVNIPTEVLEAKNFASPEVYENALQSTIDHYQPDLILLAGFMRILGNKFVTHYSGRLLNIHPSLLPKYRGLHTHQLALQAGDKQHGATVHFVTEELDGGPIIAQASLGILPQDTVESLKNRVLILEHQLYPLVISWFVEKRLKLTHGGVELDGKRLPIQGKQIEADLL